MTLQSLTDGSIIFSYKLTAIINTSDKALIHKGNTFINHLINVSVMAFFRKSHCDYRMMTAKLPPRRAAKNPQTRL